MAVKKLLLTSVVIKDDGSVLAEWWFHVDGVCAKDILEDKETLNKKERK